MAVVVPVPVPGPFTLGPVGIVRMWVLILRDDGDICIMIVPAAPAGVRVVVVLRVRVRMGMRLMTGMTMFIVVRILQNPLRVGVSARFTGLVTVRFGVAVVRHGGFLARFVV